MTQIAAEMLGLPMDRVHVEMGDTNSRKRRVRAGRSAPAARGRRSIDACMTLRGQLAQAAGIDPASATFADGNIQAAGSLSPG